MEGEGGIVNDVSAGLQDVGSGGHHGEAHAAGRHRDDVRGALGNKEKISHGAAGKSSWFGVDKEKIYFTHSHK